ncbi:SusC/RagA family TonB-linked outer membrane protein [Hufsiella ginkgonis]|uniref:SusC/RagA family TonB-linked outer membrane protein n=1 Tax=Hufsiella ginkgonis TaxID=2695274 RepID=A0A7K1XU80_9SPHI|nr:SusC/RagA family TonB-linked outer membrane protein [Hufsiella ginkgonis]MXV14358.1 SusC/RagA family TonB-linked outer membrane protein [Hufsiella ginkgonis]
MRKNLLKCVLFLCLLGSYAFAQERTVTGTVTAKEDGLPLPGVSVRVKGTNAGTSTGGNGMFSLSVPANATLVFTFIGYTPLEIAAGSNTRVNAVLVADATVLSEVVVTSALGITRSERSLGYAAQGLKAEEISVTKQPDLNTAIAGKIAGVQILGGSGARFGTSSIRIRGTNSIGGSVEPLYVVDGVVVPSTSINVDDVADLTVLKGPAATSLYGQRGDNGVVVVTSKKAAKKGVGIEVNHSTTLETVGTLPEYQNEYGGGGSTSWSTFTYNAATDNPGLAGLNGVRYHDFATDESWGPKFDGQPFIPWYALNKYDSDFGKSQPYVAQKNNVKEFYETGVENNSNVAFSSASEKYNARVSYTNINRTGISPNTRADQNRVGFNGSFKPVSKLTLSSQINFNTIRYFNRPAEGYGTQTAGSFNQWFHRDIRIDKLKNYKNPDGTYTTWNITGIRNLAPKYWDNPYTEAYANVANNNSSRMFGSLQASYNFLPGLTAEFTAKGNFSNGYSDSRVASGTLVLERFGTSTSRDRENNYVADILYNKNLTEKFSLKGGLYGELRINHSEDLSESTAGGFTVPNFFNIAATKDRPTTSNSLVNKKVRSLYGFGSAGYRDMLFLDVNVRNDWSSSLPNDANSYLYGGVSTSFVFTELMKNKDILSFGKIFASVGRVGSDIGAYNIYQTYSATGLYGTTPSLSVPNSIPNQALKPTLSDSYEAGIDLRFLKDRITFNFNYYDRTTKDQIIQLTLPSSSGFSSALVNAGEIANHGYEFTLGGVPVKGKDVTWDFTANIGINRNKIVSLYADSKNFVGGSFGYTGTPRITVNRFVGQSWGALTTDRIKRDDAGNKLIDDDGYPIIQKDANIGTYIPKYTGGLATSLDYKRFSLAASMDLQVGGKITSVTQENLHGSGLAAETAGLNAKGNPKRDDPAAGGGILIEGIRASDGKPNATYIDTRDYYEGYIPYVWDEYTYKATYVKLREVSLGYRLPLSIAQKMKATAVNVGLVARNPWLIYSAAPGIDPSESAGNYMEGGQLPGTRTFGLNLKVTF